MPDGQSRERDRTENVQTAPKLAASASTVQNTTQHACPALSSPSLDLRAFVLFLDLSLAAAWRTIRSLSCSFVLSLSNALSISACATPSATARFDNSLGFSALSSAFIVGVGAMRRTMSCSRTRLSSWDPRRQRLACRCRSQGCGGCQLAYCPGRRRHNACISICMPGPAAGRSGQAAACRHDTWLPMDFRRDLPRSGFVLDLLPFGTYMYMYCILLLFIGTKVVDTCL